jgi:hypothetical protein
VAYDSLLVDDANKSTDSPVLPCGGNPEGFNFIFRNVIGIGIERLEHTIDAFTDEFLWFDLIYIVGINFFEEGCIDIETLGDVEIFFSGSAKGKSKRSKNNQEEGPFVSP